MVVLNYFLLGMTLIYVILVMYMRFGWIRLPYFRKQKSIMKSKVSVLIAARNEEENIGRTLDCIIAQDFPKELLEVIVVDDHSTDRTSEVVQRYTEHGVKLIQLDAGDKLNSYKKFAIGRAIASSTGDIIVTTDADCRMGNNWLSTIIECMEYNGYDMLSSPVVYHEEKSWFEELQTLEFLYLIGLGAAGIGNGNPTTCNGANLAYRKSTFYEVGGFNDIDELASGDDELLLHKVAYKSPEKIGFCKSKKAIVFTEAKPTLKSFLSQRKRWASKSTKYKDKRVVVLGVTIWLFNVIYLFCLGSSLIYLPHFSGVFLTIFCLKLFFEFLFLYPIAGFAERRSLLTYLPILTFMHPLYLAYIGVAGNIGKYDWKGRNVR